MDKTLKAALPFPTLSDAKMHELATHDVQHGSTVVLRSAEQAAREEAFMARSRSRRLVKVLREQAGRARRRRSKSTPVPLDMLEALLTKVENSE